MAEGLIEGAAFAVDASLIAADANKQRAVAGFDDVDWEAIARTRRSVREYLDTLDETAWGAASETVPKFISKSDPAAQWTGAHKGHAFFAYANNYLIDLKAAIIVDVEATRAIRQAEVGAARTMIEHMNSALSFLSRARCRRQCLWDSRGAGLAGRRAGDRTTHSSLRQIGPYRRHITRVKTSPMISKATSTSVRPARCYFNWDPKMVNDAATLHYQARKRDCDACELEAAVLSEDALPARSHVQSMKRPEDVAREMAKTDAYVRSRRERKKVEMLLCAP